MVDEDILDLKYGENYKEALDAEELFKLLVSQKYGVGEDRVFPNFGSNGSLQTILPAIAVEVFWGGRTPSIVFDTPNYYHMMELADGNHYEDIRVQRGDDLEFPVSAYLEAMGLHKPDVVMLTTPNNPTGKPISDDDLDTILSQLPERSIAIIDRTLVNLDEEISTQDLFDRYSEKPIIALHSFSKSHGLSNKRIGYAVTNSERVVGYLRDLRPLTLNSDALKAGIAALDDEDTLNQTKNRIRESIDELSSIDGQYGVRVIPSSSNFSLLRLPESVSAKGVEKYMDYIGIKIMPGTEILGLGDQYVRLPMSGREPIQQFLGHLRTYLSSAQRG